MFASARRIDTIAKAELARISRLFRQSEAGWLFYGADGTAYHLTADEAARHEAAAQRRLTRYLVYLRRLPWRILATALGLGVLLPLVLWAMPPALAAASRPVIGPALFAALLVQAGGGIAYDLGLRRWQAALARDLAAKGRGGVDSAVAAHHRRHNLFTLAGQVLALVLLVRLALGLQHSGGALRPGALDLLLVAAAYAAHFAGRRVDTTHRRRKWLD